MLLSLRTHQSGQQRRPNSSMPSVAWMTRRSASACFAPVAAISDWSTACGARRRLLSLTASRLLTKEHVLALAASRACTCTMAASCSGIWPGWAGAALYPLGWASRLLSLFLAKTAPYVASLIPASRTRKPWHQDMQQLLYTPVRPTKKTTHQGTGCCWPGSPTFGFFSDWKGPPPFRSAPRAQAFLAARPHGQLCLEPHRLGIPDAGDDAWFPQCNGILDRFSLHACTWSAGGERTLRHHALRDTTYKWAARAGWQPEREEPGLLLPPEETGLGRRHPTDVSVPSLAAIPTAFDVAVTAPQRSESLREASCKTGAAADFYAEIKAAHDRTAQLCGNQGVRFQPLVFESAGAWSTSASHNLRLLA